jgi:hypothetical protein
MKTLSPEQQQSRHRLDVMSGRYEGLHLEDYQREMLESLPERKPRPAGMPNWAAVRLPFLPLLLQFLTTGLEGYEMPLQVVWGPTPDGQNQTNEA